MKMKKYLLYIAMLGLLQIGYAQKQDINFTSLTPKDGLSSNIVNAILKDRYGLMWFGTEDGLNKFDGTNFTVYRHRPNDSTSLRANGILALHEDKDGNLWVGSGGSLSLFNRKKDSFINFPANTTEYGLSSSVIKNICSDHLGKIWVATYFGLDILDPKTKKVFKFVIDTNRVGALSARPNCVFEDRRQRMWVGTNEGLFLYNRTTGSFVRFRNSALDTSSLCNNRVNAITEDKKGNLWIGTSNGLSMFRPDGKGFKNFRHSNSDSRTLSNNFIYSIAANDEDQLWIGTEDGLNIFDIKTGIAVSYKPDQRNIYSLTGKSIWHVYIDKQGIYWAAAFRGGINKYDKNLNLFNLKQSNVFDKYGLPASVVTSFAEDKNGDLFVGTDGGGLSLFNRKTELFQHINIQLQDQSAQGNLSILALEMGRNNQLYIGTFANGLILLDPATGKNRQFKQGINLQDLNSNDIFCIKEDRRGNVWIGTNGAGINVLNAGNKIVSKYISKPAGKNEIKLPLNNYIRVIEEDRNANIWIGSHGSGIAVFNPHNSRFSVYHANNSALPSNVVLSILEDSRQNIWVGTFGGGLSLFDKKTNDFITFAEKEGLSNTAVYKIVEDKTGQIWVSTNKGISSFDLRTKRFTNYTVHNGLQNNNFVLGAGIRSSDGEIFFGGADGLNYFNPAHLKKNKNVPTVLFTDLRIANNSVAASDDSPIKEHISVAKEIVLNYKQNFALSFVSLNYTAPQENKYAYKLEGFDKDWIYSGTSKTASYTNLDPGEYVFRVKASNNDGVWSASAASIKIHVEPPFWLTIYAYIFYFLAIVGFLFYIRYRGIQKLKARFALEQERIQAEQKLEHERKHAERIRELDRLKITFLTNLSHEFRTPISLISGPVDQLLSQEKNGRSSDQLQMIKRNARRLLNLVNQLLDFRKMEEHELKLHVSKGEIVSFIKDVSDSFKDLSGRKKIDFAFNSQVDKLYTVFDSDKIERILFNLLSNAFKFTLEGGNVSVEIEKLEKESTSSTVWLSIKVRDTGIGIPENKQEKIFERFFQNDTAASVLNQGTGIGLSITKEFVKMHGGTIDVKSEVGKGSTFIINLPFTVLEAFENDYQSIAGKTESGLAGIQLPGSIVHREPELLPELEEAYTEGPGIGKKELASILLVEDNEDFRFYLKDNLRLHYRVFEASNGKEGWQKALALHPQVIVSDISMPYMDGIELTRKIKADKRTSHIPVILLTAITGESEQIKGLETGANDYITKPFNFEILNAKIKNLFALNNTLKKTYTKQIKVELPEVEIESADAKFLKNVMTYLEENLTNSQLSVEDLSKQVGMSRSALYHKLLELTGQSPVEFIRSVKLDKAAILLEKSDMNIAQIAYSVGFTTANYFAKSFKTKFNMLPSEYLAKTRKGVENNS
jgi:signal transduction histidine kinase/ligand-binding sensor domain-containing protein/DNA-binding response OmpR family regulator